ncbi:MAG: FHA domain-containing protein [Myxococcales bacterium FL481]|nr:MAG: FHA domain-containing protein [Myxococcales bacterium FL481]
MASGTPAGAGLHGGGDRTEFVPGPSGGDRTEFVPGPSEGDRTAFVPGPDAADLLADLGAPASSGDRTEFVPGPDAFEQASLDAPDPRWADGEVVQRTPEERRQSDEHRRALMAHAVGRATIVEGPGSGTAFALLPKSTLGRSPDCTVTIADGTVSAVHAAIVRRGNRLVLIDWDSTGGTTLNGKRVLEAALRDGDRIGLASVTVQVGTKLQPMSKWMLAAWIALACGTLMSVAYLTRDLWS